MVPAFVQARQCDGTERNLGWLFEKGYGVVSDNVAAYALYELSRRGNALSDGKVRTSCSRLEGRMSNNDLGAARKLAGEMDLSEGMLAVLDTYLGQKKTDGVDCLMCGTVSQ